MARAVSLLLCLAASLALAGCPSAEEGVALAKLPSGAYRVAIHGDNTFDPPHGRVPAGAIVEWLNNGGTHDVTDASPQPAWSSDLERNGTKLRFGETYTHRFDQPGTFQYRCKVHEGMGMKGTLTVV